MDDSDDDQPQLSAHALAALQEFYAEQAAQNDNTSQEMPKEDWVRRLLFSSQTGQVFHQCKFNSEWYSG